MTLLLSMVPLMILQWGGDEEEVAAEDDLGDALGDAIHDAQQECESEKGKVKFERMLDDHRKLLYRRPKRGKKS